MKDVVHACGWFRAAAVQIAAAVFVQRSGDSCENRYYASLRVLFPLQTAEPDILADEASSIVSKINNSK